MNPLGPAARHGPAVLVAGLLAGLLLPGPARALTPHVPELGLALLFVSALRMEPAAVVAALRGLPRVAPVVLLLQLALPLAVLGLAHAAGVQDAPAVLALALMSAAPSIVGSPNICLMMGVAPGQALRLMVAGTALLPLSVLPVLWLLPGAGEGGAVMSAAARLLLAVGAATAAAQLIRRRLFPAPSAAALRNLEGASALTLAVFVIGLMPAVRDLALQAPMRLAGWLAVAVLANLGAQMAAHALLRGRVRRDIAVPVSVIAGNRNIALFLISLPAATTEPILAFIGCYQIPMYLTPILMRRIYRDRSGPGAGRPKAGSPP